jgi:hypothetical protein
MAENITETVPGKPSHRWNDNIKVALKVKQRESADWIHLTQDRIQWRDRVNTVRNLLFHKMGEFLDQPLRTVLHQAVKLGFHRKLGL